MNKLRIRATMKLRNEAMISAREKLGLSQRNFAKHVGVPMNAVIDLEKLDFRSSKLEGYALKISSIVGIQAEDIMPPGIRDQLPNKLISVKEVAVDRLLSDRDSQFMLPSPDEELLAEEEVEVLRKSIDLLPYREKHVVRLRSEGLTFDEIETKLKLPHHRAGQIHEKALRKLKSPWGPLAQYRDNGIIDMTHLEKSRGDHGRAFAEMKSLLGDTGMRDNVAKRKGEPVIDVGQEVPTKPEFRRCQICDATDFCLFYVFVDGRVISDPRWVCAVCRRREPYARYGHYAATFGIDQEENKDLVDLNTRLMSK